LKWHYPLGLLYDLFSGAAPSQAPGAGPEDRDAMEDNGGTLPWRLTLHFDDWPAEQLVNLDADGRVLHDAFINSVKEADFLRNGTAKGIMSLSKDDSTQLWKAVQDRTVPTPLRWNTKILKFITRRQPLHLQPHLPEASLRSRRSPPPHSLEDISPLLAYRFRTYHWTFACRAVTDYTYLTRESRATNFGRGTPCSVAHTFPESKNAYSCKGGVAWRCITDGGPG
jgi:hypothetical protein